MSTYDEITLYTGELKNGVENGQGEKIFQLKDKIGQDVVRGNFLDGHLDGQGGEITDYGNHYKGGWVRGWKQGLGKMQYKDGRVYEGNFFDDGKEGFGKMTYPIDDLKDTYEGTFKGDNMDG